MEAKQLIKAYPTEKRRIDATGGNFLNVSEFFFDTIQGEGIHLGHPAAFLRLQECTLQCIWCDTTEVWKVGNPYTFEELFSMMLDYGLAGRLKWGQHLILTGGSPLMQQEKLIMFILAFMDKFKFKPYIEVENECVLMPNPAIISLVDCWNNSPKLENSGNSKYERYDPDIIRDTGLLTNSWFKFVISDESDWQEIEEDFLEPGLILRDQIILMPEGATRDELKNNAEMVVKLAIRENVLYRSREHIVLWNKMTGI